MPPGLLILKLFSFASLNKSVHTFSRDFTLLLVRVILIWFHKHLSLEAMAVALLPDPLAPGWEGTAVSQEERVGLQLHRGALFILKFRPARVFFFFFFWPLCRNYSFSLLPRACEVAKSSGHDSVFILLILNNNFTLLNPNLWNSWSYPFSWKMLLTFLL